MHHDQDDEPNPATYDAYQDRTRALWTGPQLAREITRTALDTPQYARGILLTIADFVHDFTADHAPPTANPATTPTTLAAAVALRDAGRAAEPRIPTLVARDRAHGRPVAEIAGELGTSTTYVHRLIRDTPWTGYVVCYTEADDGTWREREQEHGAYHGPAAVVAEKHHAQHHAQHEDALPWAEQGLCVHVWVLPDGTDPTTPPTPPTTPPTVTTGHPDHQH
ncbi:hypothetical protein ACSMX9_22655 [Streptomyces sp. LE64]|uniref:hypothetical protein n=1 Tax=Streptomyces sp. LE64 TaxID=3448653 RepID=UPI004042B67A